MSAAPQQHVPDLPEDCPWNDAEPYARAVTRRASPSAGFGHDELVPIFNVMIDAFVALCPKVATSKKVAMFDAAEQRMVMKTMLEAKILLHATIHRATMINRRWYHEFSDRVIVPYTGPSTALMQQHERQLKADYKKRCQDIRLGRNKKLAPMGWEDYKRLKSKECRVPLPAVLLLPVLWTKDQIRTKFAAAVSVEASVDIVVKEHKPPRFTCNHKRPKSDVDCGTYFSFAAVHDPTSGETRYTIAQALLDVKHFHHERREVRTAPKTYDATKLKEELNRLMHANVKRMDAVKQVRAMAEFKDAADAVYNCASYMYRQYFNRDTDEDVLYSMIRADMQRTDGMKCYSNLDQAAMDNGERPPFVMFTFEWVKQYMAELHDVATIDATYCSVVHAGVKEILIVGQDGGNHAIPLVHCFTLRETEVVYIDVIRFFKEHFPHAHIMFSDEAHAITNAIDMNNLVGRLCDFHARELLFKKLRAFLVLCEGNTTYEGVVNALIKRYFEMQAQSTPSNFKVKREQYETIVDTTVLLQLLRKNTPYILRNGRQLDPARRAVIKRQCEGYLAEIQAKRPNVQAGQYRAMRATIAECEGLLRDSELMKYVRKRLDIMPRHSMHTVTEMVLKNTSQLCEIMNRKKKRDLGTQALLWESYQWFRDYHSVKGTPVTGKIRFPEFNDCVEHHLRRMHAKLKDLRSTTVKVTVKTYTRNGETLSMTDAEELQRGGIALECHETTEHRLFVVPSKQKDVSCTSVYLIDAATQQSLQRQRTRFVEDCEVNNVEQLPETTGRRVWCTCRKDVMLGLPCKEIYFHHHRIGDLDGLRHYIDDRYLRGETIEELKERLSVDAACSLPGAPAVTMTVNVQAAAHAPSLTVARQHHVTPPQFFETATAARDQLNAIIQAPDTVTPQQIVRAMPFIVSFVRVFNPDFVMPTAHVLTRQVTATTPLNAHVNPRHRNNMRAPEIEEEIVVVPQPRLNQGDMVMLELAAEEADKVLEKKVAKHHKRALAFYNAVCEANDATSTEDAEGRLPNGHYTRAYVRENARAYELIRDAATPVAVVQFARDAIMTRFVFMVDETAPAVGTMPVIVLHQQTAVLPMHIRLYSAYKKIVYVMATTENIPLQDAERKVKKIKLSLERIPHLAADEDAMLFVLFCAETAGRFEKESQMMANFHVRTTDADKGTTKVNASDANEAFHNFCKFH